MPPAGAAPVGCPMKVLAAAGTSFWLVGFGAAGTDRCEGTAAAGRSSSARRTARTVSGTRKAITAKATTMDIHSRTPEHRLPPSGDTSPRRHPTAGFPEDRDKIVRASGISFSAPP